MWPTIQVMETFRFDIFTLYSFTPFCSLMPLNQLGTPILGRLCGNGTVGAAIPTRNLRSLAYQLTPTVTTLRSAPPLWGYRHWICTFLTVVTMGTHQHTCITPKSKMSTFLKSFLILLWLGRKISFGLCLFTFKSIKRNCYFRHPSDHTFLLTLLRRKVSHPNFLPPQLIHLRIYCLPLACL